MDETFKSLFCIFLLDVYLIKRVQYSKRNYLFLSARNALDLELRVPDKMLIQPSSKFEST